MGQNIAFSVLNSTPSWKKYTTAGAAVLTIMSYVDIIRNSCDVFEAFKYL